MDQCVSRRNGPATEAVQPFSLSHTCSFVLLLPREFIEAVGGEQKLKRHKCLLPPEPWTQINLFSVEITLSPVFHYNNRNGQRHQPLLMASPWWWQTVQSFQWYKQPTASCVPWVHCHCPKPSTRWGISSCCTRQPRETSQLLPGAHPPPPLSRRP